MPSLSGGHRCTSVERFVEMSHPESSQLPYTPSVDGSYSTVIQPSRPQSSSIQSTSRPNGPLRGIIKGGQPPNRNFPPQQPRYAQEPENVYRPTVTTESQYDHNGKYGNSDLLQPRKPFNTLSEVYSDSGDTAQFAGNLRAFINDHVPFYVWITFAVLEVIVGLVSVFIGSYNLHMCDVQEYIPLYLILSGSALIVHGIIRAAKSVPQPKPSRAVQQQRRRKKKSLYPDLCMHGIEGVALLYMLTCVVLGCVWVYGYRSRYVNFMPHMFEEDYCDKTLYWVAWWSVTIHLAIFAILILAVIFIVLYGSLISDD